MTDPKPPYKTLCLAGLCVTVFSGPGLPIESAYKDEVGYLRHTVGWPCQFALFQGHSEVLNVVPTLFCKAYWVAVNAGCHTALIAVPPKRADGYGMWTFTPTGWPERPWDIAGNLPVKVLKTELATVPQRLSPALRRRLEEEKP